MHFLPKTASPIQNPRNSANKGSKDAGRTDIVPNEIKTKTNVMLVVAGESKGEPQQVNKARRGEYKHTVAQLGDI